MPVESRTRNPDPSDVLTLPIRESLPATPRAQIIRLELNAPFSYRAGQAAYLLPHGAARRRPYSIASAPEQTSMTRLLEFLVQTDEDGAVGGISRGLLQPGNLVALEGPIGSFQFPAQPRERHFLFIAGGTGIAPLRSMLWHALLAERGGHITLIHSVRSPEELAYLNEFEGLAAAGKITFHSTVTRAASEGWAGRQGRIDAAYLKPLITAGDTLCFLCGPPALVGELPDLLHDLGVGAEQIRTELGN